MKFIIGILCLLLTIAGNSALVQANDMSAEIIKTRTLVENRKNPVLLRLEHKEKETPVMQSGSGDDISLYIIDPALEDFHHVTALPTDRAGDYIFTLTPHTDCGYRLWAVAGTEKTAQTSAITNIPGAESCHKATIKQESSMEYSNNNYRFQLELDNGFLKTGQETTVRLFIRNKSGASINNLQLLNGAYAHITGFYDDYKTIALSHSVEKNTPLTFKITPERTGTLKLFAQVRIENITVTAPFTVTIQDAAVSGFNPVMPSPEEATAQEQTEISEEDLLFEQQLLQKSIERERARKENSSDGLQDLFREENSNSEFKLYEDPEEELLKSTPTER